MSSAVVIEPPPKALSGAGFLLGFALGGFFDGILLHQILQWHHLLSGLTGAHFADIRVQILADGAFHALMYVLAAIGLALLWKARRQYVQPGADRGLFAMVLIGFGVWHVVDSVVSHWLIGLHRIRMDAPSPLMWDLIWFFAFGLVPLALGLWLRRRPPGKGSRWPVAAAVLAIAVLASGAVAALPPPNLSQVVVLFRPGTTADQVMAAAAEADARVVWADASGQVWAFDLPDRARSRALYSHGALWVGNSLLPAGCLAWAKG